MPTLRVASYNVRYFGHGTRGLAAQDTHLDRVAHTIAHLDGGPPDIMALQEVETHSIRADVGRKRRRDGTDRQIDRFVGAFHEALKKTGCLHRYRAFYYPAHIYRLWGLNFYTTGLAILIRSGLQVLDHNAKQPHDITHRRIDFVAALKQTRICAHLRLRHQRTGAIIDLFNTHLSLPAFFTMDLFRRISRRLGFGENQLLEAQRLGSYIDDNRHPDGHLLLMGDFNSLPHSPVYEFMTGTLELRDALREYHNIEEPHPEDFPTAGLGKLRLPIDYLFSCENIEWLDFDGTHHYGDGPFHTLSDHMPIIARFRAMK